MRNRLDTLASGLSSEVEGDSSWEIITPSADLERGPSRSDQLANAWKSILDASDPIILCSYRACRKRLSYGNNQKERDTSYKSLIFDARVFPRHQKRVVHWLIILATALICHSVTLKEFEI